MFVDGLGSDVEGEEFNSEGCQWEVEEEDEEEEVVEEEKQQAAPTKPPSRTAAAIPEKVLIFPLIYQDYSFLQKDVFEIH